MQLKEIFDSITNTKIGSTEKYRELQDISNGYSKDKMLSILKDRAKYLMERGSTLNNPHIPGSYFKDWEEITENHAAKLREMVQTYIINNVETEKT